MLEYAVYCVISPEGCASILWKDQKKVETAAREMKMTATDLAGARHRRRAWCRSRPAARTAIPRPPPTPSVRRSRASWPAVATLSTEARLEARYQKFRRMGSFLESGPGA